MSRRIHMICNAHIDPVWQWEWEEGAAEALSTFRIAADFCDRYDDFVFCHNEALLYEWIEEYDPELFARIQKLVAEGKWHVMGGWHLQPDCNMPSGEALVRQILRGRKYFSDKFGVYPTTAINVDSFGHTRGLVQILAKSGYDSYLFLRPAGMQVPADDFKWIGYDGSYVTASKVKEAYASGKGNAAEKVKRFANYCEDGGIVICMWGVGNHGGGPSEKDIQDIQNIIKEAKINDNGSNKIEFIHSTPENYFKELKEKGALPEYSGDLNPWAPGCYTSMVNVKQKYRQTENMLFMTEKMCSQAAMQGIMEYPEKELEQAVYDMVTIQFHDALPGSSVQPAEEMCLRYLDHALEIISRVKARAFFALCRGQKKADNDAIPIMVYNPHPYEIEDDFEAEFMLWDQNWSPEFQMPVVFHDGRILYSQCEKENSSIPIEWRKRVVFHAKLKPMSMNRFDCRFKALPERPDRDTAKNDTHFIFENEREHIEISRVTGLVDKYIKDGSDILGENSFALDVFEDNYDPWGMTTDRFDRKTGEFKLLNEEESTEFTCVANSLPAVRVIESGDVRTMVEAVFGYKRSRAVIQYVMSKKDGMKINVRIFWEEKQKMVKMRLPAAFKINRCITEQAFGEEDMKGEMRENCIQKYAVIQGEKISFALCNMGTYGASYDDANNIYYTTLLRSPSYCAHPIGGRQTMPQDRFCPYIDQGERMFKFEFIAGRANDVLSSVSRKSLEFNEKAVVLSFYPTGSGKVPASGLEITGNETVQMTAFKKAEIGTGFILRLFNPSDSVQNGVVSGLGISLNFSLSPYEVSTFRVTDDGNVFAENLTEDKESAL